MNISTYADLLQAARAQAEPQRLLFVFTHAELPQVHTDEQKARFKQQQGGALTPVMCVDKLPEELADFASLVAESEQLGQHWEIVFAAGMSGRGSQAPSSEEATQSLEKMVEAIRSGQVGNFLAFNRTGDMVSFL